MPTVKDIRNRKQNTLDSGLKQYAHQVVSSKEKVEDLGHTISSLISEHNKRHICIYASTCNHKELLHFVNGLQVFPKRRAEQILLLRRFRKGDVPVLLSDAVTGKMPEADAVIHFDLPKTPSVVLNRIKPTYCNIFFYSGKEKVYLAHLQNLMNTILINWELKSKEDNIKMFIDGFGDLTGGILPDNINIPVSTEISKNHEFLSSLMYLLYYKLARSRKQYLLYDPTFSVLKTRSHVETFLSERGISNYCGITLTEKGFCVESYDMLRLPLSYKSVKEMPHIRRIRDAVTRSYISSLEKKRRVFAMLRKHRERGVIRTLRRDLTLQSPRPRPG